MIKRIELPTVGEILKEEFMDPCGISAYRLAKDIFVPTLVPRHHEHSVNVCFDG